MKLTEHTALQAYARMMNTMSTESLEPLLAEQEFLDYMVPKLKTIVRAKATVYAEMGTVAAYGRQQPCVILAQNEKNNLVGIVLAKVAGNKLKRLDLCVVPPPEAAERSGEYPT
jgi:hypothetical protein